MNINSISNRTIVRILAVVAAFTGTLFVGFLIHRELIWFITALFFAVALNPAVEFFAKFMPKKSRGLAAFIVFILAILILALIFVSIVPPLASQTEVLIKALPGYFSRLQKSDSFLGHAVVKYNLIPKLKQLQSQALNHITDAGGSVAAVAAGLFSGLAAFATIAALTIFMLIEGPFWLDRLWELMPQESRKDNQKLAGLMYKAVTGYVNGLVLTCLFAGVATTVILKLLGFQFAVSLGALVALLDLLPLVGGIIGAGIVISISLFSSLASAIILLVFFIILYTIENQVLRPVVFGRVIGISPLLVLMAVIAGTALAGFVGALVAIPVAASIQIIIREYGLPGLMKPSGPNHSA